MAPGPTMVPSEVRLAASAPMIHHRTPEFIQLLKDCRNGIARLLGTAKDPVFFTSSGTGAMEAAVVNLLSPGDTAIVITAGEFGQRWINICRAYGVEVVEARGGYGQTVHAPILNHALWGHKRASVVFCQHSETSTGVLHDIKQYAAWVRQNSAAFVVDAVSSVGVAEIKMDAWGIDVVVGATQKGLMCPPGLGFCCVSEKAMELAKAAKCPKFYFDLLAEADRQGKGDVRFTPAVDVVLGLAKALEMIHAEGAENVYRHHQALAAAVRAGVKALGLKLFAQENPSPAITSICTPEGITSSQITAAMAHDLNTTIAGGQGPMKDTVFRIGHMGYCDAGDVITTLAALERVLAKLGYEFSPGSSLAAAQKVFIDQS